MKSKFPLSMLGLLLIAISLSAFTNFAPEDKNVVNTEVVTDDGVILESFVVTYKGIQRTILSNSTDKFDQVIIKAIKTIKSRAATDCQCEMSVVDGDAGQCVTVCMDLNCPSGCPHYEVHDCCNQPMYPCQ